MSRHDDYFNGNDAAEIVCLNFDDLAGRRVVRQLKNHTLLTIGFVLSTLNQSPSTARSPRPSVEAAGDADGGMTTDTSTIAAALPFMLISAGKRAEGPLSGTTTTSIGTTPVKSFA